MPAAAMQRPPFRLATAFSWLAVGLLRLLALVPASLARGLCLPLGALCRVLLVRRRRIAERNIERCFPELKATERQAMVRDCFRAVARTLFEAAWCWSSSDQRLLRLGQVEGLEHIVNANKGGRGVLVVTAHLSSLELGGRLIGMATRDAGMKTAGIYRPLKNPVIEWYQNRGRLRYAGDMISKRDLRSAIRLLRSGGVIWYAPDQDFGTAQSSFAPFFGIEAASLSATHKLPRLTGCAVVPMFPMYDEKLKRYRVRVLPPLENFPSDDERADLTEINRLTEQAIRQTPGQYWWIHRRFKTRPPGEAGFYD